MELPTATIHYQLNLDGHKWYSWRRELGLKKQKTEFPFLLESQILQSFEPLLKAKFILTTNVYFGNVDQTVVFVLFSRQSDPC